jgi:hypothetical protein
MSHESVTSQLNGERDPRDYLYQINESPFGKSYKRWTADWWNWLVGIPKRTNPANDTSGRYGSINQPEKDVWYLAGEVKGKAKRKVSVPHERAILFPVVNFEWSFYEMLGFAGDKVEQRLGSSSGQKTPTATEDDIGELREFTQDFLDDMYSLDVVIDEGTDEELRLYTGILCKYRVSTDFDITFAPENIFNTRSGTTKASSDGYWMFIREGTLKQGQKHTIWLRGVTQYYQTEVTYEINIT